LLDIAETKRFLEKPDTEYENARDAWKCRPVMTKRKLSFTAIPPTFHLRSVIVLRVKVSLVAQELEGNLIRQ
jgi:hypothetical protein